MRIPDSPEEISRKIYEKVKSGMPGELPPITKKFIFLDIDGVLAVSFNERGTFKRGLIGFDDEPLRNLEAICEAVPEAKIVISSTWRIGETVETLREIFEERGFKYFDRIIDVTPRCHYRVNGVDSPHTVSRGTEINHWLKENVKWKELYSYVILDDDGDMLYWQQYNFIHTSSRDGLLEEHVPKAIEILKEDCEWIYKHRSWPARGLNPFINWKDDE